MDEFVVVNEVKGIGRKKRILVNLAQVARVGGKTRAKGEDGVEYSMGAELWFTDGYHMPIEETWDTVLGSIGRTPR